VLFPVTGSERLVTVTNEVATPMCPPTCLTCAETNDGLKPSPTKTGKQPLNDMVLPPQSSSDCSDCSSQYRYRFHHCLPGKWRESAFRHFSAALYTSSRSQSTAAADKTFGTSVRGNLCIPHLDKDAVRLGRRVGPRKSPTVELTTKSAWD